MAAMASVRVVRMLLKAASMESWLITVTSSSPSWRSRITPRTRSSTRSKSALASSSSSTLNSPGELNICSAVRTGTMIMSRRSSPRDSPRSSSTPITRMRRSPARTHSPMARRLPNNSCFSLEPSTHTARASLSARSGRILPWATSILRTWNIASVLPNTITSRERLPRVTGAVPAITGATALIAGRRSRARASSRVRSRGAAP